MRETLLVRSLRVEYTTIIMIARYRDVRPVSASDLTMVTQACEIIIFSAARGLIGEET
jgi:hypothetical protein